MTTPPAVPAAETATRPAPAGGAARSTYREVWGEPLFRVLWTTRTLSIVADSLRISTLSVLIYSGTRSPLLSAVAYGIGFLPQLFGSALLGAWSDRLRPRALIAGGYLLDALAAALLGVFALRPLPVGGCLAVVGVVALLSPVFNGASGRLVAETLTGDAYVLGRSLSNIGSSAAQLVGLAGSGAAVAALGPRPALLAGAALLLAVAAAVRLRLPDLPAPAADNSVHSHGPARREGRAVNRDDSREESDGTPVNRVVGDAGAGTGSPAERRSMVRQSLSGNGALLRRRPVRRQLLAQWLPSGFSVAAESLIVAYCGVRGFPAGTYAVLLACLPVGMLTGDLVVGRFVAPLWRERLVVPLVALLGAPLLAFAAHAPALLCGAALLASGAGFAYGLGLQRALLAALPEQGQGQAFALLGSGNMTVQGVGPALFGVLAAQIGTGRSMAAAGVGVLLTAAWIGRWHRAGTAGASGASGVTGGQAP